MSYFRGGYGLHIGDSLWFKHQPTSGVHSHKSHPGFKEKTWGCPVLPWIRGRPPFVSAISPVTPAPLLLRPRRSWIPSRGLPLGRAKHLALPSTCLVLCSCPYAPCHNGLCHNGTSSDETSSDFGSPTLDPLQNLPPSPYCRHFWILLRITQFLNFPLFFERLPLRPFIFRPRSSAALQPISEV